MNVLALDIGGANLKAVWSGDGPRRVLSRRFALWREPAKLLDHLLTMAAELGLCDEVLVTTTAELCDCFPTKRQGVAHVVDAAEALAAGRALWIWSTAGGFVDAAAARRDPLAVAAANWHAQATWVARLCAQPSALLLDVGSTTSDLIPLSHGRAAARGLTDMDRLRHGELVYLGAMRTPLMALGPRITLDGVEYHVMAEHFATTADVNVLSGELAEDASDRDTADGRPLTREHAAARVLRMIGADCDMVDEGAAGRLAAAFAGRAVERLAEAILVLQRREAIQSVLVSGSGAFWAQAAARQALPGVTCVDLAERVGGGGGAEAACAWALVELRESER